MLIRSPLPDLEVPEEDFSRVVLERGRRLGDKTALIDARSRERVTYAEFVEAVDGVAGGLRLQAGERVVICGFNGIAYAVAAHAVWRAGGTVVTMNPLFTPGEMRTQLADAAPAVLIGAEERSLEAAHLAGVERTYRLDDLPSGQPPRQPELDPAH